MGLGMQGKQTHGLTIKQGPLHYAVLWQFQGYFFRSICGSWREPDRER